VEGGVWWYGMEGTDEGDALGRVDKASMSFRLMRLFCGVEGI
jgi:hypothetical protein